MSHEVLFQGLNGAVPRDFMKFQCQIKRPSRIRLESSCISLLVTTYPTLLCQFNSQQDKKGKKTRKPWRSQRDSSGSPSSTLRKKTQGTEIPKEQRGLFRKYQAFALIERKTIKYRK